METQPGSLFSKVRTLGNGTSEAAWQVVIRMGSSAQQLRSREKDRLERFRQQISCILSQIPFLLQIKVVFFFPQPHQSTRLEAKLFKALKRYLVTFLLNLEFSLQAQGVLTK